MLLINFGEKYAWNIKSNFIHEISLWRVKNLQKRDFTCQENNVEKKV